MKINKKDLKVERTKGQGAGGQHKNKTCSMIKLTHIPTGITSSCDGRNQHQNYKNALKELKIRIIASQQDEKARQKKQQRDYNIHNTKTIRTYDFKSGLVKNHINGKTAPLKEVLYKGHIDLLK